MKRTRKSDQNESKVLFCLNLCNDRIGPCQRRLCLVSCLPLLYLLKLAFTWSAESWCTRVIFSSFPLHTFFCFACSDEKSLMRFCSRHIETMWSGVITCRLVKKKPLVRFLFFFNCSFICLLKANFGSPLDCYSKLGYIFVKCSDLRFVVNYAYCIQE